MRLLLIAVMLLGTSDVLGQGTIYLSNRVPEAGIDAPVALFGDGLSGPVWAAQMFVSVSGEPNSFSPVGDLTPFQSAPVRGYWLPSVVTIPGVAPGDSAWLQVRVWYRMFGDTWEEGISNPDGFVGQSPPVECVLGGLGAVDNGPTYMVGLQAFDVFPVPEPSSSLLVVLGLICVGLLPKLKDRWSWMAFWG